MLFCHQTGENYWKGTTISKNVYTVKLHINDYTNFMLKLL